MKIVNTHCPGIAQFTGARLDANLLVMYVLVDARASETHPHSYRVYKGIVAFGTDHSESETALRRTVLAEQVARSGTKCSYAEARLHFPSLKDEEYN